MIAFKKYNSIENSFNDEFMQHVIEQMPADLRYVVQEKVHGANTSFLCDGSTIEFAKRTSIIVANEKFYDHTELLDRYKQRVMHLFGTVKQRYPEVKSISLFGEMFGGRYPHPDVEAVPDTILIQKGVFYSPRHDFYAFDLYLNLGDDTGHFLPVAEANALFEAEGFFYAKTLFEGTLDECLNYPNAFESNISQWLGLPPIADNICEGVVIRPVTPMYLRNGSRVLIKNKNERFAEKKSVKKRNKMFEEPVPYSEALKQLVDEAESYVTENRMANVLSHIGQVSMPKDFGKVMGMYSKDALADFMKEHGYAYTALDKCEQKSFNRELNKLSVSLVKQYFANKGRQNLK